MCLFFFLHVLCAVLFRHVTCLGRPYFSALFHKRHDSQNRNVEREFSLQHLSEMFTVLTTIQTDIITLHVLYGALRLKYRYFCQVLINLVFSRQIFKKLCDIGFHENPLSGSRVVPCGQTDRLTDRHEDRRADRHDETVVFHNFTNALENHSVNVV